MSLITPAEFTGIYSTAKDEFTAAEVQVFIDQHEPHYLLNLLGVELYNLFIADLNDDVPQSQRFLNIYNAFTEQGDGNGFIFYTGSPFCPCVQPSVTGGLLPGQQQAIYQSFGMKDMLLGFVYLEYNRSNDVQATPTGNRTPDAMAANMAAGSLRMNRLTIPYNRAIESYQAIQWYCKYGPNKDDYPEFKGIPKGKIFMGGAI